MEQKLEHRIRVRAYEIWSANGCIDGQANQHWLAAEREVLAALTAAPKSSTPRQPRAQAAARATSGATRRHDRTATA